MCLPSGWMRLTNKRSNGPLGGISRVPENFHPIVAILGPSMTGRKTMSTAKDRLDLMKTLMNLKNKLILLLYDNHVTGQLPMDTDW